MMDRIFRWVLVGCLLAAGFGSAAADEARVPICGDSLCVRIGWGDGPDQIASGDTALASIPAPLFDVDHGTVYVLDRLKGRLLTHQNRRLTAELLPSFDGVPFADFSDLRVADGRFFLLAVSDRLPVVFTWDPAAKRRESIPLRIEGPMQPPEKAFADLYKLTVAPDGVYLFQRQSQWSLRLFNGQVVPFEAQVPEEGLVVGAERVRFEMPRGVIRTVAGKPLASGSLRASGNGCVLVAGERDGMEVLEMHDLATQRLTRTPTRPRERWRVTAGGTRLRVERGYYELYFNAAGVHVVKWNCPGW